MTPTAATSLSDLTLNITQDIQVRASVENTFDALLHQLGPANEGPEGQSLPMVIEARPGGRWFRDLGQNDGHFWGLVQAIKRPSLLEITGPLFISAPIVCNVQYRLEAVEGGTIIRFRHSAFGFVPDDVRPRAAKGWQWVLERVRKEVEGGRIN